MVRLLCAERCVTQQQFELLPNLFPGIVVIAFLQDGTRVITEVVQRVARHARSDDRFQGLCRQPEPLPAG